MGWLRFIQRVPLWASDMFVMAGVWGASMYLLGFA